ncbi:unnamed protein product [Schistosoma turkestanicum]|nr:unnamed protein product [Schistosoma turkestanicum]
MYSKSLPSSAFVSGRLKIRDTALDYNIEKGKRAKSKTTSTFRIVESCMVSGGLRVGNMVWAKLAGCPYWSSRFYAIWARTAYQLSQATLLPTSQSLENNASSLAVLATPSDPS